MRHETALAKNPRMALQVKNVARLTVAQKLAVNERAAAIRRGEVGVDLVGKVGHAAGVEAHA
jgi:deoxyribodipyrimidine photolyase-related protein